MKPAELLRLCAGAMEMADEHGYEPGLNLVWPKGSRGRFPIHGRLLCVNSQEDKVYGVKIADVLAYISRELKRPAPTATSEQGRG